MTHTEGVDSILLTTHFQLKKVQHPMPLRPEFRPFLILLPGILLLTGCGSKDDAPKEASPGSNEEVAGQQQASPPGKSGEGATTGRLTQDANGRTWYDDVPLDVWIDNPLAMAGQVDQTQTVAGTDSAEPEVPGGADDTGDAPPPAEAGNEDDWAEVIPEEQLLLEIKNIRNRLAQRLTSVGAFNGSMLELPPQIATLAVASDVVRLHSTGVSWKPNAAFISAYAGQMMSEPLQRGPATFRRLESPFLNISGILEGNPPAEPPEVSEEGDFSANADFGDLMKRLEIGLQWLQVNVGTENAMKENAEEALTEALVIAMLTKVIETEGYGYSDDEEFRGYSGSMYAGSRQIAEAIRTDKFADFEAGLSQVYKACTECHSSFRN